jgi:hypothetical protein
MSKTAGAAAEHLLGQISVRWAWIEQSIDELIAELTLLEPEIARSITNNATIRPKIQMLKALAHLKKPSEEWSEFLISTLDYLDNVLRPYRNNYVHGGWYAPKRRQILRIRKTRIKKPQALQPSTISTEQELPIRIREMRKLHKELVGALRDIVAAHSYIARRDPKDALPPISFAQFLRRSPLARQKRARAKRLPPPLFA